MADLILMENRRIGLSLEELEKKQKLFRIVKEVLEDEYEEIDT